MSGIRHIWNARSLAGDWVMSSAALDPTADLETAIIVSLFTDRWARDDDRLPSDDGDRRGWWGDSGTEAGQIGSRLWLLSREKQTEATRQRAEEYAREALSWLVSDKVARRVEVRGEWIAAGVLGLTVVVYRRDGDRYERRFDAAWREVAA
ncbi:MAG: phage GP46 family protein [Rhodospirillales bacterium]|nr:phage GP46 family protein [Rhodospirillales bacterium]